MQRWIITGILGLGIILSARFSWSVFREPPLTEPQAISTGATHAVVDLLRAPGGFTADLDGAECVLPRPAQRYVVAALRDGAVSVGWSADPSHEPDEVLTFASGCVRVAAYADRHRPGIIVVYASRGWTAESPRQTLTIRTGTPESLP